MNRLFHPSDRKFDFHGLVEACKEQLYVRNGETGRRYPVADAQPGHMAHVVVKGRQATVVGSYPILAQ